MDDTLTQSSIAAKPPASRAGIATRIARTIYNRRQRIVNFVRRRFYRLCLGGCGPGLRVHGPLYADRPENIFVGRACTINAGCVLNARARITIGDNCRLSAGCMLITAGLQQELDHVGYRAHNAAEIHLADNVWIGAGAIVLAGVHIGERAIIGAGAVVTKDVPAFSVALGVPAVAKRTFSDSEVRT